jgi:hypothetical protein
MAAKSPAFYLSRLRGIAKRRGGALLSTTYSGDRGKLRFRCALGHEWWAAAGTVAQGSWCYTCGRARIIAAHTGPAAQRLRRLVSRKGGTVLSPEYRNNRTKLRYRCALGHEWEAVPGSILVGRWCPVCARASRARFHARRKSVVADRLARIVGAKGGRILAPGFVEFLQPLPIRCERGHRWSAPVQGIQDGAWCPYCRHERRLMEYRAVAEQWGGRCLSKSAPNGQVPLRFECAVGHRFERQGNELKRGVWCPECRGVGTNDLARMHRLARERAGDCLSVRYEGCNHKLRWRCREGHEWRMAPGDVVRGHWCPECAKWKSYSRARLSIADMRLTASERGGRCLSSTYEGNKVRLQWRCARGHSWWAHPNRIRQGSWCPVCSMTVRGTLEGMKALAIEQGGRCLTRAWDDHRLPLEFQCARGHLFDLPAVAAKSGVWCPTCTVPGRRAHVRVHQSPSRL